MDRLEEIIKKLQTTNIPAGLLIQVTNLIRAGAEMRNVCGEEEEGLLRGISFYTTANRMKDSRKAWDAALGVAG